MPDLDSILKEFQEEHDLSEDAISDLKTQVTEALGPKFYREAEKRLKERAEKADEYEAELKRRDREPEVLAAFEKQGLDLDAIEEGSPLLKKAILDFTEYEDEKKVAEFIEANRFPTKQIDEGSGGEEDPPAAQIQNHGRRAQQNSGGSKTKVTLAETEKWSAETWAKFEEQFPDQAALLGSEKGNGEFVTEVIAAFTP